MVQTSYTNDKLLEIAKENYWKLTEYCEALQYEGYWEQPEMILKMPILEMLDVYIQAVLINLSIYCGTFDQIHKKFIIDLPNTNGFLTSLEEELEEDSLKKAKKLVSSPPILIQLCGVRDVEENSGMLGKFFDSFLNILLSASCLEPGKDTLSGKFIQEYFERISAFLINTKRNRVDERYLNKKLSSDKIEFYPFEEEEKLEQQKRKEEEKRQEEERIKKIEEAYQKKLLTTKKKRETVQKTTEKRLEQREEKKDTEKKKTVRQPKKPEKIPQKAVQALGSETKESTERKERYSWEVYNEAIQQVEKKVGIISKEAALQEIKLDWGSLKASQQEKLALAKKEMEEERLKRIHKEIQETNNKRNLDALLEELNQLVGLENVKKEVTSLINLIKVRNMRKSFQMPEMDMTYHMVFTGNPGTGKTTVARLIAKIYKELGLLSKGTLVETDRAGLVAGFVGQTAMKVKEVIEKSIGGVLFIDEAYSLTNQGVTNDFGGEAVDTLVKMMEDHRDDLVVIVAGYKKEMQTFLKSNTGLVSRFNKFIDFPDYTIDELMKILDRMAEKSGMIIEDNAKKTLKKSIQTMKPAQKKSYGNARGIRNTFEKIMVNQANRIVTMNEPTMEQLCLIMEEDMKDIF